MMNASLLPKSSMLIGNLIFDIRQTIWCEDSCHHLIEGILRMSQKDKRMKCLGYIPTLLFLPIFFIILVIFHPIQIIAHRLFGYGGLKTVVDYMNGLLMCSTMLTGTTYRLTGSQLPEETRPYIIVANHQSMFDISPLIWYFRKMHPKFVAKIELARGKPGISYNLRHGGSVVIDRSDRDQSIQAIRQLGQYIEKYNRSAIIFPEGTRSSTEKMREWKTAGILALLKSSPNAVIIPVTIRNSWKLMRYKGWPIPLGTKVDICVHQIISPESFSDTKALLLAVKDRIQSSLDQS